MSRRSGLGRGLAALIPPSESDPDDTQESDRLPTSVENGPAGHDAGSASVAPGQPDFHAVTAPPADAATDELPAPPRPATATLAEISPDDITPNPRQPREVFDEAEIEGLAVSLLDVGVLQPLVVRPVEGGGYELVAGERRLRAAKLAGLDRIPVVVRHTDDSDLLKEALVENIHRVQLNPLEEAAAYQQLLQEFDFTQEELANRIGKSRPSISNALRLLTLPSGVQRRVATNILSAGHAKALLALADPAVQERFAERVVAEGLSVRAIEELVRLRLMDEPGDAGDGTQGGSRGSGKRRIVAPGLVDLQDDLSDALESRVRITMGARKGKLTIEFASVDDLERIVGVIAGGLESGRDAISMPSDER